MSTDHAVCRPYSLHAVVYILTTKVFFIPPTPPEKIFSFPVIFQRNDTRLWTHQCRFYKYYSRKCSVKTKLEGKIMKQVRTYWAEIRSLKLLFWSGGWLDSNENITKSVN